MLTTFPFSPAPGSPDIRLTLRLRPLGRAARPAAAWWLSGSSPALWLAEIRRWSVDLEAVRLVFPDDDEMPGVLALPGEGMPSVKPRGLAFGLEAGTLWLPCDAALSPPVTDGELRELLTKPGGSREEVALWHPARGLMRIGPERITGIAALLRGPARRSGESNWLAAVPVEPLITEIRHIRLTASPIAGGGTNPRDLFGDAAAEIGSETPEGLPPEATGKTPSFWRRMLPRPKAGAAPPRKGDTAQGGGGGGGAGGFFGGLTRALDRRRWAALQDLVEDLRNDPDKGLRRAIPFGGGLPRGFASPGARLPERAGTEFDIGRVGLSGRVDLWNIPAEYHAELRTLYHDLALREKRLGRWRRAAYIYAELLGDLAAAAAVLKEGGCFRDAALLYRDHLDLPRAAAECLVAGGFHTEAAELYEREFQWEEAGEAWHAAGREEVADECFRRASAAAEKRGDFLRAAMVEEEKRGDAMAALAVLWRAWPEAEQAEACLRAEFDITVSMVFHNFARERVRELRGMKLTLSRSAILAKFLGELSRTYPDETVRAAAREGALERLSELLRGPLLRLVQQAAQWLSELHPDDTLLARDAARHAAARAAALRPVAASSRPASSETGTVSRLHVKRGERRGRPLHRVLAADAAGEDWFLLGRDPANPTRLLAVRGSFREGSEMSGFPVPVGSETERQGLPAEPIRAVLAAGPGGNVLAADAAGVIQGTVAMPVKQRDETPPWLGRPAWLPEDWAALTATPEHWLVLRDVGAGQFVSRHAPDGTLLSHAPVPVEIEAGGSPRLAAHGDWIVVAAGAAVVAWTPERVVHFNLESPVTRLAVSPWWSRPSVVAGCERGCAVLWPGTGKMFTLSENGESPAVGFTTHGHVIAADAEHLVCAVSHSRGLSRVTRLPWREDMPVAVLRAPARDGFLIVDRSGFLHPGEIQR